MNAHTNSLETQIEAHIEMQDLVAIQRARALCGEEPSQSVAARLVELEAILADVDMG
jgi:hypothetical protein